MLKRIKYWYWRKYKEIPHFMEMAELYKKAYPTLKRDVDKSKAAGLIIDYLWCLGDPFMTIKDIAEENNITRTRVKSIIWKYYRRWKNRTKRD